MKDITKSKHNTYNVSVINLSSIELGEKESSQLSLGLDHSYIDKNKHMKKNFAADFVKIVGSQILNEKREDFHEFLLIYCYIFTSNVYSAKDYTYSNLKRLIRDDTLVVLPDSKNYSVIITYKGGYVTKMLEMIKNGIQKVVYVETLHITRAETFPDFMYQTFKNNEHYKNMYPSSNQPAKFYRTAKLTSLKTLMKSACNL